LAGNMVDFRVESGLLLAAGLWDRWVNPTDGEVVESFTIITDEPYDFVRKTGHDRSPLFLGEDIVPEWLDPNQHDADRLKGILKKGRFIPKLMVDIDRPLRPGWEKRRSK
ncbi:MAG: SOS response-associated peptidase family protein, partial [Bdellovibrionota bacterium]